METVQVFTSSPRTFGGVQSVMVSHTTKNQQQWKAKPLEEDAIREFRTHAERLSFGHIVAHDSYLINLASPGDELWEKSIAAFAHEMERCDQLAIPYLVTHPGAHVGSGEEAGIARVVAAMTRIFQAQPDGNVTVCLETTAGQGSTLGYRFEQIKAMLDGIDRAGFAHRVAVCVDTCHILAGGYDITHAAGAKAVLNELDRVIGLSRVKVWHVNDSKKPCGSRVDRHEHIGRGCIGVDGFAAIMADPRLARVPKIMETPKDKCPDGREWDLVNLELLRGMAAGKKMRLCIFKEPKPSRSKKPAAPVRGKKPKNVGK